jgi:beta-lactamase regulating signal transducer with metallopeptidase domain
MARLPPLIRAFVVLVLVALSVYVGDDLFVRYRLMQHRDGDPVDSVTLYYATKLKNGQVEIYYHQPVAQPCVKALVPHLGLGPCWYVRRTKVLLL